MVEEMPRTVQRRCASNVARPSDEDEANEEKGADDFASDRASNEVHHVLDAVHAGMAIAEGTFDKGSPGVPTGKEWSDSERVRDGRGEVFRTLPTR